MFHHLLSQTGNKQFFRLEKNKVIKISSSSSDQLTAKEHQKFHQFLVKKNILEPKDAKIYKKKLNCLKNLFGFAC
jgi:hypothetical protein